MKRSFSLDCISSVFKNSLDYFFDKNIKGIEKIIVGIAIIAIISISTIPDFIPFLDEVAFIMLTNTFFKKRIKDTKDKLIYVDFKEK